MTLFSRFGEIIDILRKDDYAFIEFATLDGANNSIKNMNGYNINGSRILVEQARPKDAPNKLSYPRLYVGKQSCCDFSYSAYSEPLSMTWVFFHTHY